MTLAASALAAKGHTTMHFTDTSVGASISATQSVAVVHDPANGQGASVETVKVTGNSGTGRIITYWVGGTTTDVVTFTLGTPVNGLIPITGTGRQVGATGKFKGSKATVKFLGTVNATTGVSRVTIKGTVTT